MNISIKDMKILFIARVYFDEAVTPLIDLDMGACSAL